MTQIEKTDVCIIGAGSGGLSAAAGLAAFGVKVTLVESDLMGGDCLNYGCVPSKALLAAAKAAQAMRDCAPFGISPVSPSIDFKAVKTHVREVIKSIAPNDSVERFEGLGVNVIKGQGRFVLPDEIEVADKRIRAKKFIVCTGSRAAVPPIPGLDKTPFLTNESIFDLDEKPQHLIIIGAGPIGLEMAQAHRRLGSKVTVLEASSPFANDDPELAAFVLEKLAEEGVSILSHVKIEQISHKQKNFTVHLEHENEKQTITGSHLLVAAGRKPNIENLGLMDGNIEYNNRGIRVDQGLRSVSNRDVFAIGDVAGGFQFTHVAGAQAGVVLRSIMFKLPAKFNPDIVSWCTYTDPELAQVGLRKIQAEERFGKISVVRWSYDENDRAQAERKTKGLCKLIFSPRGHLIGAGVVGHQAGEMANLLSLAIARKMKAGALSSYISPYPTLLEIPKRAAVAKLAPAAKSPLLRRLIKSIMAFG